MDWTVWGLGRLDWLFFASALNIIHTPAEESLLKEISRQICGDQPVRFYLHHRA
jgi:hypothetical protein